MGEVSRGKCHGCLPAQMLVCGLGLRHADLIALRSELLGDDQRQQWLSLFAYWQSRGAKAVSGEGRQTTAAEFATAACAAIRSALDQRSERHATYAAKAAGIFAECPGQESMQAYVSVIDTPGTQSPCAMVAGIMALRQEMGWEQ